MKLYELNCKRLFLYLRCKFFVLVKVDFAAKMPDGTIVLLDWKTGKDDDDYESELQMAAYVLWAKEFYNMSADEIATELVFLRAGATKPYAFFEDELREVRDRIAREFAAMNASYEYADFPAGGEGVREL